MAGLRKSTKTAKLIIRGGYQYVILPKEFEFKGKAVRIYKQGDAVVLAPVIVGVKRWLADLGRRPLSKDFMAGGRHQPIVPKRNLFE